MTGTAGSRHRRRARGFLAPTATSVVITVLAAAQIPAGGTYVTGPRRITTIPWAVNTTTTPRLMINVQVGENTNPDG